VSARDTRLMGDLEKLLGKKLELEALELASDRQPAGHFNDGQRAWQRDETQPSRERRSRERGEAPAGRAPSRPPRAPADPLFDKPYEPSLPDDQKPTWEADKRTTARAVSPNIKTRKKVPMLFKPVEAPAQES
jgi:hypothetical protein